MLACQCGSASDRLGAWFGRRIGAVRRIIATTGGCGRWSWDVTALSNEFADPQGQRLPSYWLGVRFLGCVSALGSGTGNRRLEARRTRSRFPGRSRACGGSMRPATLMNAPVS
jgi:hypothetical protein